MSSLLDEFNQKRMKLNKLMVQHDDFFASFGRLDDTTYAEGAIPKKYKELTGLSISVFDHCDECIAYHIQGCLKQDVSKAELVEVIKIGVIGGGSTTYPSARYAFKLLQEIKVL